MRRLSSNPAYTLVDNAFDNTLWFDPADQRANLLLVGNSHSKDLYNTLMNSAYARANFEIARYGAQIRNLSAEFFRVPNYEAADVVMIASRYSDSDLQNFDWFISRVIRDGKKIAIVRNIFEFDESAVGRTIADAVVRKYVRNGVFDGPEMRNESDIAYYENYSTRERRADAAVSDTRIDLLQERFPSLIVLNRMDYACDDTQRICYSIDERLNKFYYDYGHQTLEGAAFFGKRVDQIGWLKRIQIARSH